ncbi:MAG TPA: hypothetical protein VG897_16485, partial [Terriglobales bacterium]|nr:hypothetical protein [Terriglobales bacterium]
TIFSQPTAVSADQLHQKLVVSLQQSDIIVGYNESGSDEGLYGVVEELSVKAPEGHSNMLVVQVKYAVACGSDSTLYVFEHTGTQWRMRIALEQNDYEAVAGALGFFDYVISPPDEQGNWYLLYATIGNWCTSNWHGITYRVITPGEDAYSPRTVFSDGDGVYIGEDNVYKLTANRNDFQVSYRSNHQLDSGLLIRTHVHHYTFSPKLERIAPLAMSPNGFLDEWIHLAWPEAEKWTRNPTNYVHRLHDLLQKAELGGEIELEQPCTNSKSWLIGLADEDLTLYANVELLGNDYYLRGLSFRRPRGCPGTTRPEQETDELP